MSKRVQFLFETVVDARREWVEAQEQLTEAQRKNFIYCLELVRAMEAEGITTVTHDGVTLTLTDDEEVWENNPLDNLEDDDDY